MNILIIKVEKRQRFLSIECDPGLAEEVIKQLKHWIIHIFLSHWKLYDNPDLGNLRTSTNWNNLSAVCGCRY